MRSQQHRAQRRRERERVDRREEHGDGHGHGELPEQLARNAGNECHRHEHRQQHQGDPDDRSRDLAHGLLGRIGRRELGVLLHHPFDVLDHDDRVVDDDADGEHEGEQRDRIGGIADHLERDECSDQADRNCQRWDQRRAQTPEEQEHHDDHENESFDQRFFHLLDRLRDEAGRVVGDFPGQIIGEPALQLADPVAHGLQRGDRIGPRRLVDRHRRRRPPVQARFAIEIGGAQFHPRDVAEPQHRSIGVRADDDALELGDRAQPALGLDVELQLLLVSNRPGADASDGGLNVLGFDRIDDVAGGQPEPGQPVGPQPDAHGVILRTPERCISDAGRALDPVEQIDRDVVRDEQRIVRMLGRVDGNDAEQGRRFLLDGHALASNVLRQAGKGNLHTIVHVDGIDVRIGAELERSGQRVAAVVAAHALHVDQLVDADDLGFDRLRNGRVDHRGRGAGKCGRDGDLGRNDIGILRDRYGVERQCTCDRGDDRDDDGEARSIDEDRREHGIDLIARLAAADALAPPRRDGSPADPPR